MSENRTSNWPYWVAGIVLVLVVGAGALIVRSGAFDIVRGTFVTFQSVREGMNAPGTAELREIGCDTAMVTTVGKLLKGTPADRSPEIVDTYADRWDTPIIQCVTSAERAAGCESVARTYAGASGTSDPMIVWTMMLPEAGEDPASSCNGYYGPGGTRLGAVAEDWSLVPERRGHGRR